MGVMYIWFQSDILLKTPICSDKLIPLFHFCMAPLWENYSLPVGSKYSASDEYSAVRSWLDLLTQRMMQNLNRKWAAISLFVSLDSCIRATIVGTRKLGLFFLNVLGTHPRRRKMVVPGFWVSYRFKFLTLEIRLVFQSKFKLVPWKFLEGTTVIPVVPI